MNKLTPKRMLILSALLLVGCCEEMDNKYIETPSEQSRHTVYHPKPSGHVFVINNTPHTRPQILPSGFVEKPHEIGLVDSNGRVL